MTVTLALCGECLAISPIPHWKHPQGYACPACGDYTDDFTMLTIGDHLSLCRLRRDEDLHPSTRRAIVMAPATRR